MSKTTSEMATEITIAWLNSLGSLPSSSSNTPAYDVLSILKSPDNVTDFYKKVFDTIKE